MDAHWRLCRCMAHSLNLAAKHVLEAFASTPPHILVKRKNSRTAKPADVDQDDEEGEFDENELVDFKPGDLLGKAHAFVTQACLPFDGSCHGVSDRSHLQVRLSPQARAFLSKQCGATNVPRLELLKWCRTRWSSMDNMIERLIELRPVGAIILLLMEPFNQPILCSRRSKPSSSLQMTATKSPNSRMAANTRSSRYRMQNGNDWG